MTEVFSWAIMARAGNFQNSRMARSPDAVVLRLLLFACRTHPEFTSRNNFLQYTQINLFVNAY